MKHIIILGLCFLLIGCTDTNLESTCYQESFDLWNSVNTNYPKRLNDQQVFDKLQMEACANRYYLVCLRGDIINCSNPRIKGVFNNSREK